MELTGAVECVDINVARPTLFYLVHLHGCSVSWRLRPDFFLRPQFLDDPLPVWMHIHGALFTRWYFVAILQSWLVLKKKLVLHRELGVVPVIIVISGFILTYVAVAYLDATGQHLTGGAGFSSVLTSAFTCCFLVGVYFRQKPEINKRLIVLATAVLTVPDFDRLIRIIVPPNIPTFTEKNAQTIVQFFAAGFVIYMIYRDIKQFKRPSLGIPLAFVCFFVGALSAPCLWTPRCGLQLWSRLHQPPLRGFPFRIRAV